MKASSFRCFKDTSDLFGVSTGIRKATDSRPAVATEASDSGTPPQAGRFSRCKAFD